MTPAAAALSEVTSLRHADVEKLTAYLDRLVQEQFWGYVSVQFAKGQMIAVKEERTRKPEEL